MKEFTDLDAYLACFLFSKGLDKPVIRMGGDVFKMPLSTIDKAVSIAKDDKDYTALKNACNAYRLGVCNGY